MTSSPEFVLPAWLRAGDDDTPEPPGAGAGAAAGGLALPDLGHALVRGPNAAARSRVEESHALGYEAGLRDGEARAAQTLAPAVSALYAVTQALSESRERWERDRAHDLEGLALAVARMLFQREVRSEPTVVRELVAQALDLMPAESVVDVRLHPVDLAALAGSLEVLHAAGRGVTLQWIADPALDRGSFLLETPSRIVDGRLDVALKNLYERLGS